MHWREEAASIGLYGFGFMASAFSDGTGLTLPVAARSCPGAMPASVWRSSARRWWRMEWPTTASGDRVPGGAQK